MGKVKISILGLAKYNNGYFKSEKQSDFLIKMLEENDGHIGFNNYNNYPIFVKWDKKGITEIVEIGNTKKGVVRKLKFQRKIKGVITDSDIKEIKRLNRIIKSTQGEIDSRLKSFELGKYKDEEMLNDIIYGKRKYIDKLLKKIDAIKGLD